MTSCRDEFKKCCPRLTADVVADALYFLERDGYKAIETVTAYTGRTEIVLEGEDIPNTDHRKGAVIRYNSQKGAREEATISFPTVHQIREASDGAVRLCHGQDDGMKCLSKFVQDNRDQLGVLEETWIDFKRDVAKFFSLS